MGILPTMKVWYTVFFENTTENKQVDTTTTTTTITTTPETYATNFKETRRLGVRGSMRPAHAR